MKKLLLIIAYAISLNLYADRKVFMTAGGDVEFHHDGGYLYIGRLMKIDTISCLPSDQICYSAGIIKKQWEILKCPDSLLSDSYYQQAIACPNVSVDVIKSNANPGNTRAEITQNERFFGAVMHIQSTGERVTYVKSKFWSSMIKSFPVDNNDVLRPTVILEILFIFLLSIIVVQKLRSRIIERNDITNNFSITIFLLLSLFFIGLCYLIPRTHLFWYRPQVWYAVSAFFGLILFTCMNHFGIRMLGRRTDISSCVRYGLVRRGLLILCLCAGICMYYATVHSMRLVVEAAYFSVGISTATAFLLYGIPFIIDKGGKGIGKIRKLIFKLFPKKQTA